jgi:flavin reductase (DIM6/NTAB) family NADH-FMN oxidoreductase RutF
VPAGKLQKGYRHESDKFGLAGLTAGVSETVGAPRVMECPVQMEVVVEDVHSLAAKDEALKGKILTLELRVQRVHLEESIIMEGHPNRVDPDKWRPLMMSFQEFYGLGDKIHHSRLATIPERLYHTVDIQRANEKLTG